MRDIAKRDEKNKISFRGTDHLRIVDPFSYDRDISEEQSLEEWVRTLDGLCEEVP